MASLVPDNPDALLRRKSCAEALTEAGFPTAPATLATKATRDGGPPFRVFGRIPLYRWGDAIAWAEAKLSAPPQHLRGGRGMTAAEIAAALGAALALASEGLPCFPVRAGNAARFPRRDG